MGSMSRLTNHDEKLDENVNFANSNQAIVKRNNKAKVNIDMQQPPVSLVDQNDKRMTNQIHAEEKLINADDSDSADTQAVLQNKKDQEHDLKEEN